jgi:hypothetical protein
VNECIGLSIVALNEAEALHRVEELDRAAGFFTGQLALWCATETAASATAWSRSSITVAGRTTIGNGHWLAIDLEVGCRDTTATIDEGEAQRLTFGKTGQTGLFDSRDVNEHVFCAIIANDETETLLSVEELYDTGAFTDDLGRHAATSAATATAASETTAAAESAAAAAAAEAIATTAAEAITAAAAKTVAAAASETAAVAASAAAFIAAEAVALVASTSAAFTATTSIETHALPYSFENIRPLALPRTYYTGRRAAALRRESIKRQ